MRKADILSSMCRAGFFCLVLLAAAPAAASTACPEEDIKIDLRKVMWQFLPREVYTSHVGPGDRVWYELSCDGQRGDLPSIRRAIERQFKKPSPQLRGVRLALFEPGGRVWFITQGEDVLLGFDGMQWTERRAPEGQLFTGGRPNHGLTHGRGHNMLVDGTVFFPVSRGVVTFSDRVWDYREMVDGRLVPAPGGFPRLVAEPGGKGVFALARQQDGVLVWRWRDGTWERIALPREIDSVAVRAVVPEGDGLWVFDTEGVVSTGPLLARRKDKFTMLLEGLIDESYWTREEATAAMIAMGKDIEPRVEEALERTGDPEIKWRLQRVLKELGDGRPEKPQRWSWFGPYELFMPVLWFRDKDYTMYVSATDIRQDGEKLGPGILVRDASGETRLLGGRELAAAADCRAGECSGVLVQEPGRLFWVYGVGTMRRPRLLDAEKGEFVAEVMELSSYRLHAVAADGTVYAGGDAPGSGQVAVYKPLAPDERKHVAGGESIATASLHFVIAADGTVFARTGPDGVSSFDRKGWRELEQISAVAAGERDGPPPGATDMQGMIFQALAGGKSLRADHDLRDFIARNREQVIRHLQEDVDSANMGLHVDRDGNIWVRSRRALAVLAGDEWLNPVLPLVAAGAVPAGVQYVTGLGDGSKTYVLEAGRSGGRAFYGEVREGKVAFEPANHSWDRMSTHMRVRDLEGGLWVPVSYGQAKQPEPGTEPHVPARAALRVTEKGVVQELRGKGWPVLCDRSGNVWLGFIPGRGKNKFNIWRDGEIVEQVTIPAGGWVPRLVSDRPGSVFAWTPFALYHLVADEKRSPARYEIRERYGPPAIPGRAATIGYSEFGYFAVSSLAAGGEFHLSIIPVPDGD